MTLLQAALCIPNRRAYLFGVPGVYPKARYSRMKLLQAALCIPNRRASLFAIPGVYPKARENIGWHGPPGHAIQHSRLHRIPIVA